MTRLISAYTDSIWPELPVAMCHVLGSKFQYGGGEIAEAIPLELALALEWETDAHCTMYSSPANVRATKTDPPAEITFECALFDLDFAGHRKEPTLADFADCTRTCWVIDEQPNAIYQTRHGCRLIYLIEAITDAEEFEQHYQSLLARLDALFVRCEHAYRIDAQAKDWTRLFRLPNVQRDNRTERGEVRIFHDKVMDLRTFRPKQKPTRRVPSGTARYDGTDLGLLRLLRVEMAEGSRNQTVFKAVCHCCRHYRDGDLDRALDAVWSAAQKSGLDDTEISRTIESAKQREMKNGRK
jgi:hypothetical protein